MKLYKLLFVVTFLFCINSGVFAEEFNLKSFDNIELQFFNRNFFNESLAQRLNRLENIIYGKTFSDSDQQRLNRICDMAENITQYSEDKDTLPSQTETLADIPKREKDESNYPIITQLENSVLKQTFKAEDIYSRLNRLESSLFGTVFQSEELDKRVERLKRACENSDNTISEVESNKNLSKIITDLEMSLLNQTFIDQMPSERLDRLEKEVFGAIQTGEDEERLNRILRLANQPHFQKNNYQDYSQNFMSFGSLNNEFFESEEPQVQTSSGSLLNDFIQSVALPILSLIFNKNGYNSYNNAYPYGYNQSSYYSPYYPTNSRYYGNYGVGVQVLP